MAGLVRRPPRLHHFLDERRDAREVVRGALQAAEALPAPTGPVREAGRRVVEVVGRDELAGAGGRGALDDADGRRPPLGGEGVLVKAVREVGDGGRERVGSSLRGGGGAARVVLVARGRLAGGGGGDGVVHGVWGAEAVLPGGACEGEVLKHGGRGSRLKKSAVPMYSARWRDGEGTRPERQVGSG